MDPISYRHLVGRLALIENRARGLIDEGRHGGSDGGPGFSASYEHIDRLPILGMDEARYEETQEAKAFRAELEAHADEAEDEGIEVRVRSLARAAELTPLDEELLLAAAAPAFDQRFPVRDGHLHDDRDGAQRA